MANFVEQAVLRVNDQSTKTLRKINSEIKKLRIEARKLDGMPIGFRNARRAVQEVERISRAINKIPKAKTATVNVRTTGVPAARQQIDRVARNRTATVAARPTNVGAANAALNRVARNRTAIITPRVVGAGGAGGGRGPAGGTIPPRGDGSVGDGIRQGLNPQQIGRDMARGFTFSIQGELYQVTRAIVRTIATAPVNLDDALARASISGRDAGEIAFLRRVAEAGSAQFQAATEADIIANSGEVIGRFGDLNDPLQQEAAEKAILRLARNIQILDQALPNGGTGGAGNQARLVETAIQQLGATNDAERAQQISRAVLQAIIASGGDLQASDVKRTLQQLPTGRSAISDDTLLQALLIRDEGGRRSTGNFDQLLSDFIRGNLNAGDKGRQLNFRSATGLSARNADGSSDLFTAFGRDFLGTVEREIAPLLAQAGIEIERENAGQIRAFLDNELGLSKQGGITFLTDALVNLTEAQAEFDRARRTTPEVAIESPTIRQELRAVAAQFENVAASGLEPLIPSVKAGLDTISDTLNSLQAGEDLSAAQIATASAAAIPVAFGAALQGFADPATRPLATAGLALTGSAAQLTAAAGALGAAAAISAAGGGGRGGGRLFRSARALGVGAVGTSLAFLRSVPAVAAAAAFAPTAAADGTVSDADREFGEKFARVPDEIKQALNDFSTRQAELRRDGFDSLANDLSEKAAALVGRIQAGDNLSGLSLPTLSQGRTTDAIARANRVAGQSRAVAATLPQRSLPEQLQVAAQLPSELERVFGNSNDEMSISVGELEKISGEFGPAAAAAILAAGPEIGAAIGTEIRNRIGEVNVNVNQRPTQDRPTPRLRTGGTSLE